MLRKNPNNNHHEFSDCLVVMVPGHHQAAISIATAIPSKVNHLGEDCPLESWEGGLTQLISPSVPEVVFEQKLLKLMMLKKELWRLTTVVESPLRKKKKQVKLDQFLKGWKKTQMNMIASQWPPVYLKISRGVIVLGSQPAGFYSTILMSLFSVFPLIFLGSKRPKL